MNIALATIGLVLLSATQTLALGGKVRNDQCPYTEDTGKNKFCFRVLIEIEGLSFSDICTGHKERRLENALVDFHNAGIDCACPTNGVTYTGVDIIRTRIGEGDGGNLDRCNSVAEEYEYGHRNLEDFDTVYVEYSVTGDCGAKFCPTNPLPGSSAIDRFPSGNGGFRRHLRSIEGSSVADKDSLRRFTLQKDDSECFEPLFVETLNDNGFEQVTGVNGLFYQSEKQRFCASIVPSPTPAPFTPPFPTPPSPTPPTNPRDCKRNNPCKVGIDQFYYEHRLPTQFVQCDAFGGCFEQRCPEKTRWSQAALVCVHA